MSWIGDVWGIVKDIKKFIFAANKNCKENMLEKRQQFVGKWDSEYNIGSNCNRFCNLELSVNVETGEITGTLYRKFIEEDLCPELYVSGKVGFWGRSAKVHFWNLSRYRKIVYGSAKLKFKNGSLQWKRTGFQHEEDLPKKAVFYREIAEE